MAFSRALPARRLLPVLPAALLAALPVAAPRLPAQTIAGRVLEAASRRPAARTPVALVDDSARIVARTQADSAGVFYADAPRPGHYRVVFFLADGSFVSPRFALDSGAFVQHEFLVTQAPDALRELFFARDVERPALPREGNPIPPYPVAQRMRGVRGIVSVFFVVSERGRVEMETIQVVTATDSAFVRPVRDALRGSRFYPAERRGTPVRQVVQMTFDFGCPGDPPAGDVVIRALDGRCVRR